MGIASKALNFIISPLGAIIGGTVGKLITAAALVTVGIVTGQPEIAIAGIAYGASALKKKPKVSRASLDRLGVTLDPAAPRTFVFGRTALATDVRYHAYSGSSQEYYEQIVCVASHEVEAIEEIWFDTEKAWTSAGGAQGRFAGYLTITTRLVGTSGNGIAIDGNWTSTCTLTGCAYFHAKYKLTGNTKKAESPFAQSVPTRVTVRGKGAKVPDPRLSTGAGGSGSQNMADQTTWAYTTAADSGRNLACQLLFFLLGWKINGKLAVSLGAPSARIDFASFITGANICDESVAKAGGGTQPRYRGDGIFNEDDDPDTVLTSLLQAMNGELTDENGKLALRIDFDDLATPVVAFTAGDVLDGDDWRPTGSEVDVNIVRGRFTDPSDGSLYQFVDYPQVTLAGADFGSTDGIQRIETFDLPMVQDAPQAQRLAKLRLQRKQYPGVFNARFNMRAWGASYGKVVTLSHASLPFSAQKFRVIGQKLRTDGSVDLSLRELNSAQYTWSAEESAVVAPAAPTAYDPLNDPLVAGIGDAEGATIGVDLTLADGTTIATETGSTGVRNTGVSIGSSGALAGGGGGQVTIGGLGYVGDLGATRGDNIVQNALFQDGTSKWVFAGGCDWVGFAAGSPSPIGIRFDNGAAYGYAAPNDNQPIPVEGRTVFPSALVRVDGSVGDVALSCAFYDNAGTEIGSPVIRSVQPTTTGVFQLCLAQPIPVPVGAFKFKGYIERGSQPRYHFVTGARFAWTEHAATVGARLGANFLLADGITLGTETGSTGVRNNAVTISVGGALSGGGGGQVTIGGLGYVGDLRATSGDNIVQDPLFIEGSARWLFNGGAAYVAFGAGHPSATGINFSGTAADGQAYANNAAKIPVAGRSLYLSALVFANGALGSVAFAAAFYDSADAFVSTSELEVFPTALGVFQLLKAPVIAVPVSARTVVPFIERGPQAADHYVTGFRAAWTEDGSTVGARIGTNILLADGITLGTETGSAGLRNNAIAIGANGALAGGGGGQVTFGGLGGGAAGTQGYFVLGGTYLRTAAGTDNLAETGSFGVRNNALSIGSDGALAGGGGGQVTFGGLGGGAVGTQGYLYLGGSYMRDAGGSNNLTETGTYGVRNTGLSLSASGAFAGGGGGQILYDSLADGSTYAKILGSQLSSGAHKLTVAGSGTRVGDQRNLRPITTMNLGYKWPSAITYSAAAGTPATATISVAAATVPIGSVSISYNALNVGVSGTGGSSVTYQLYFDDAAFAGGSPTLVATTTGDDVLSGDSRVWVGSVTVLFPTSGTGGGGGLGGGGGGECVCAAAWVETRNRGFVQARDVEEGDVLRVLSEDRQTTEWDSCTGNSLAIEDGWLITSASGVTVTLSSSTPITLRDGRITGVAEINEHELPIFVTGLVWESCTARSVGRIEVAHILCGQRTYAAGDVAGRQILTHNPKP